LLASPWISTGGVSTVTVAGISGLFALPLNIGGQVENP
jgi:hypothetical protein